MAQHLTPFAWRLATHIKGSGHRSSAFLLGGKRGNRGEEGSIHVQGSLDGRIILKPEKQGTHTPGAVTINKRQQLWLNDEAASSFSDEWSLLSLVLSVSCLISTLRFSSSFRQKRHATDQSQPSDIPSDSDQSEGSFLFSSLLALRFRSVLLARAMSRTSGPRSKEAEKKSKRPGEANRAD